MPTTQIGENLVSGGGVTAGAETGFRKGGSGLLLSTKMRRTVCMHTFSPFVKFWGPTKGGGGPDPQDPPRGWTMELLPCALESPTTCI